MVMRACSSAIATAVAVTACGRIDFDPLSDGSAGGSVLAVVGETHKLFGTITASFAMPAPIGAGDLVIVGVLTPSTSSSVASIVDNASQPFASSGARCALPMAGADATTDIWYQAGAPGGATMVTVTLTANLGGQSAAWILDVSGASTTAPLAAAQQSQLAAAATGSAPAVTTTAASAIVFSLIDFTGTTGAGDTSGIHAGSPFTALALLNGDGASYFIAQAPGNYGAVWDESPQGTACASTAAFQ
jgi:hypothetical protein